MSSLLIDNILKKHKITDYLNQKGIFPEGHERNGKIFYKCPLHIGDNTPSFVVYTNSAEYENFFCFGCKARYNIIHLYRDLEKVTLQEAIGYLSDGIVPTNDAEVTHAVEEAQEDNSIRAQFVPDELVLMIARHLYDFLKIVNNDPENAAACDKIFQKVEQAANDADMETLIKIDSILQDVLPKKVQMYMEAQEKKPI